MGNLFKNLGLLFLSTAIVLTALGILVQNYMQSREFIEKISQSFSETTGGSIEVESLNINLLRGGSLNEVQVLSDRPSPQPFLTVEKSLLTYNPLALFMKKLELNSIVLEQPTLSFTQASNGSWWFPRAGKKTRPVLDTGFMAFEIVLKDFSLKDGNVTAVRKAGETVLQAEGIDIEGSLKASEVGIESSGNLSIDSTRLGNHFTIHEMSSPFNYQDEVLTIPRLTGSAYGGNAAGSIEIDLRVGGPEFSIALNLENLDVAEVISDFQGKNQWLDGKLTTLCRIEGRFEAPELLQGTGTLKINEGTLSGFGFLKELAQLFPDQSFPETRFDTITGNYKIAEKILTIYDLEAVSADVQLTGTGTIDVSRELNIEMRLSLSETFTDLMKPETAAQFSKRNDGFSTITFTLSGTLDQPNSNLMQKLRENAERQQAELNAENPADRGKADSDTETIPDSF